MPDPGEIISYMRQTKKIMVNLEELSSSVPTTWHAHQSPQSCVEESSGIQKGPRPVVGSPVRAGEGYSVSTAKIAMN